MSIGDFISISSPPNFLGLAGIIYDIVGAIVLARGLIFVSANAILLQSSSGYGFSTPQVKLFSEQKTDGISGLLILLTGFFLQGLSAYGLNSSVSGFLILLGVLAVILCVYLIVRIKFTRRFFKAALRTFRESNSSDEQRISEERIEELWSKNS